MKVRKIDLPFADAAVPRWWLHGNPSLTHAANGLNLLFAPGERFFIRSVKHFADQIEDPELKAQMRTFYGQEGRHGHEHERANRVLREHGYEIDAFLERYEKWAFATFEKRSPPVLRLAATVACEHFTATLAGRGLTDEFLDGADPTMARLLKWHAAEEIEHKSVAFDVLLAVDPRYSVRAAGLALACTQLFGWWIVATRMLRAQEGLSAEQWKTHDAEARQIRRERSGEGDTSLFRSAIVDYLRRDFHPDQVTHDRAVAERFLASLEPASPPQAIVPNTGGELRSQARS